MKTLKKIKYKDIKNILEKNSLEVQSKISNEELFQCIKTI